MNTFSILGRLVAVPEIKVDSYGKKIVQLTIARTEYRGEKKPIFVPIRFTGAGVESLVKYAYKGSRVLITGYITTITQEQKESSKSYTRLLLIGNYAEIIDFKQEDNPQDNQHNDSDKNPFLDDDDEDTPF